jgi:hypothetical protein
VSRSAIYQRISKPWFLSSKPNYQRQPESFNHLQRNYQRSNHHLNQTRKKESSGKYGFQIPYTKDKISSIAYADDLTPIATTASDMLNQLNIIHSYLAAFNMKMRASKCSIGVNLRKESNEFNLIQAAQMKLNGTLLETGDTLIKILDVYLTLDGKSKETFKHADGQIKRNFQTCRRTNQKNYKHTTY